MSVAEARSATNNSVVRLEGLVLAVTGAESYSFGDATGEIEIVIKPYLVDNVVFQPETRLRLTGELRQRPFGPRVDVGIVEVIE